MKQLLSPTATLHSAGRSHSVRCLTIVLLMFVSPLSDSRAAAGDDRSSPQEATEPAAAHPQFTELTDRFKTELQQLPADFGSVGVCSQRGDLLFFLGRYQDAVDSYRAMVKLEPQLDTSHWRLGIAYFFNDQAQQAFQQFDKYHAFDDVDRENGIWRYLSQYRAAGAEPAKKQLLRYAKDDREPFPAVYQMFDGTLTAQQALDSIAKDLPAAERDKRLFYTELYIGMHQAVQGNHEDAQRYLQQAVSRQWPRTAGFGPHYMWQVARLQLKDLQDAASESDPEEAR